MSYGRLNIWVRYSNCDLITDCWRQDLVIKTCDDKYLVDIDPSVIERIKAKHPEYPVVKKSDNPEFYHGEIRIQLGYPNPMQGKFAYHVEVDIPPGCYKVWTRVCRYGDNDETNKIMVVVNCGEEVCVNLLLDGVQMCGREFIHPFLRQAIDVKLPAQEIQAAAKAIMNVAQKPEKDLMKELDQNMEEARLMKDKKLIEATAKLQEMFGGGMKRRR
jgi:hypothetical protein